MSTPLRRYNIITGTREEVEHSVNEYLETGWEPHGSLVLIEAIFDGKGEPDDLFFAQAVTRTLLARKL